MVTDLFYGIDPRIIRQILKQSIKTNKALIDAGAYAPVQVKEKELEIAQARLLRFLLSPEHGQFHL